MTRKTKVSIIGAGRVGQTLGYLLNHSPYYQVVALSTQKISSARRAARFIGKSTRGIQTLRGDASSGKVRHSINIFEVASGGEIIFITTPDDKIKGVFSRLCQHNAFQNNALVIHCSGNFSSDILKKTRHESVPTQSIRIKTGSLHPLQTFATPRETVRYFRGTICSYESDSPVARPRIVHLIKTIGGVPVRLDKSSKPIYHSAGVIASNYLVTLIYLAQEFLKQIGFPKHQTLPALLPLIEGTINNIKRIGFPDALTGPVARGDVTTVKEHLKMIKFFLPKYLPFYKILGKHTVALGQAKRTLSRVKAQEIKRLFTARG